MIRQLEKQNRLNDALFVQVVSMLPVGACFIHLVHYQSNIHIIISLLLCINNI